MTESRTVTGPKTVAATTPKPPPSIGDTGKLVGSVKPDGSQRTYLATLLQYTPHAKPPQGELVSAQRKQGHFWVKVKIRARAIGNLSLPQSLIEYLLVDSDGTRYAPEDLRAYEPPLSCCGAAYEGDVLQPGDQDTGFISFQVPDGANVVKLRMSPQGTGDPVFEWKLTK